jgi:hypothetical protein
VKHNRKGTRTEACSKLVRALTRLIQTGLTEQEVIDEIITKENSRIV